MLYPEIVENGMPKKLLSINSSFLQEYGLENPAKNI